MNNQTKQVERVLFSRHAFSGSPIPLFGTIVLGALALFQEWLRQTGDVRESTNGDAITVLLQALKECQEML